MVQHGTAIQNNLLSMNKYHWVPQINGFLDLVFRTRHLKAPTTPVTICLAFQLSVPLFEDSHQLIKSTNLSLKLKNSPPSEQLLQKQLQLRLSMANSKICYHPQKLHLAESQLLAAKSYYTL